MKVSFYSSSNDKDRELVGSIWNTGDKWSSTGVGDGVLQGIKDGEYVAPSGGKLILDDPDLLADELVHTFRSYACWAERAEKEPPIRTATGVNYRKVALKKYRPFCAHCGHGCFGFPQVLEVGHVDHNRANNAVSNLVLLCLTCHKMYDLGLILEDTILAMRNRDKSVRWSIRMKDAGKKALDTKKRRQAARKRKWHLAGKKAAATKAKNKGNGNRSVASPFGLLRPSAGSGEASVTPYSSVCGWRVAGVVV